MIGTNSDDGDAMVAAEGPQVFQDGVPDSDIDPILEYIIQNYYTPASQVIIVIMVFLNVLPCLQALPRLTRLTPMLRSFVS